MNKYTELNLEDGQRLRLLTNRPKYEGTYDSQIVDITPNTICITAPLKGDRLVPLLKGDKLTVFYLDEFLKKHFDSTVLKLDPRLPLITIKRPKIPSFVTIQIIEPLVEGLSLKIDVLTDDKMEVFDSTVKSINGDRISINTLRDIEGKNIPVNVGDELRIYYKGEIAKYLFDTEVIEKIQKDSQVELILAKPDMVKIMTRRYKRVNMNFPVKMEVKELKKTESEYYYTFADVVEGETLDISEGGMGLTSAEPLSLNTKLIMNFSLPDGSNVSTVGEIVRCEEYPEGSSVKYKAGVNFEKVKNEDRDKIRSIISSYEK